MVQVVPHLGHGVFNAPKTFYIPQQPFGNAYAIYPVSGTTYVFTGTAATLNVGIVPAGGSYTYTGTAATLGIGMPLTGSTYTYSGTTATLGLGIPLSGSTYTYSGTNATLGTGIIPTSGTYSYLGSSISIAITRALSSNTYSFLGTNSTLDLGIVTDSGIYSYLGTNASLNTSVSIVPIPGSYVYLGTPVDLQGPMVLLGGKYNPPEKLVPKSSHIDVVLYDKASGEMQIRFKGGDTYRYNEVDPKKFKGMTRAKSAGTYFSNKIKPNYTGKKL